MKRALLLVILAACSTEASDPPWQLAHDRVIAVRFDPPHVPPGEVATIDALIAHADGPVTVEVPRSATASGAPGGLFTAVHYYIDHWRIDGPEDAALDPARDELGLAAGAPVPIDVTLALPGPLYAKKTAWLGDAHPNPPAPALSYGANLEVGREYELEIDPPPGGSVRWLTSCGELRDDTRPRAVHVIDAPCEGELVIVVRDPDGGTAWQILPLRVP